MEVSQGWERKGDEQGMNIRINRKKRDRQINWWLVASAYATILAMTSFIVR